VSGPTVAGLPGFDPEKVLLDPYAKGVFFPPAFDRELAIAPCPNAGKSPLGILPRQQIVFDWEEDISPRPEADAIIYELHVKGFTKNPNSNVYPSRAGTYAGVIEKIPYQPAGTHAAQFHALRLHQHFLCVADGAVAVC